MVGEMAIKTLVNHVIFAANSIELIRVMGEWLLEPISLTFSVNYRN